VKSGRVLQPERCLKLSQNLRNSCGGAKLWEQGFCTRSVGDETTSEMIKRYIEKQDQQRSVKSNQLTFF